MDRREFLKAAGLAGLFPTAVMAKENHAKKYEKEYLHDRIQQFPAVCACCGNPLTLFRVPKETPERVGIGCMQCNGTYTVSGDNWDEVINAWEKTRNQLTWPPKY